MKRKFLFCVFCYSCVLGVIFLYKATVVSGPVHIYSGPPFLQLSLWKWYADLYTYTFLNFLYFVIKSVFGTIKTHLTDKETPVDVQCLCIYLFVCVYVYLLIYIKVKIWTWLWQQHCEFKGSLAFTVRPCFKETREALKPPHSAVAVDALWTCPSSESPWQLSRLANSALSQIESRGSACFVVLAPHPVLFTSLFPYFFLLDDCTSLELSERVLKNSTSLKMGL